MRLKRDFARGIGQCDFQQCYGTPLYAIRDPKS
jgi:hypothetical protein